MRTEFEGAYAEWSGDTLTVSTGEVRRSWRLIAGGLATTSLLREGSHHSSATEGAGTDWIVLGDATDDTPDWWIRGLHPFMDEARLSDVEISPETGRVGTADA